MPKRTDIKKVMVIGSGPIVIGQAAEFDYAGTQACLALKEEGYEVVLVNSNPATIQTDVQIADKVYMEPLTLEYVAKIVRYERPDAIVPGLGGQTGLNLAVQLAKKGVLQECQVEILGTSFQSIEQAEDRELFKEELPCFLRRLRKELDFANGANGVFFATNCDYTNESVQIKVACEKASFLIEDDALFRIDADGVRTKLCENEKLPGAKFYFGASHGILINKFYRAIENNTDDYIHVRDAEMSIRLIDAIHARPPSTCK